jgi:hypothetical protein
LASANVGSAFDGHLALSCRPAPALHLHFGRCSESKMRKDSEMKQITDNEGKVLAYQHETANRIELRSRSNGLIAWHDKKNTDRTYDKTGRSIGGGDQTGRFISHDK